MLAIIARSAFQSRASPLLQSIRESSINHGRLFDRLVRSKSLATVLSAAVKLMGFARNFETGLNGYSLRSGDLTFVGFTH